MKITVRTAGAVSVLDLDGKLVAGDSAMALKEKVHSLIVEGNKNFVLNLGGVAIIDSSGLGEIISCLTAVSRVGGKLKLANVTKRNKDLLSITKLLTVFETFDTDTEAVESFVA